MPFQTFQYLTWVRQKQWAAPYPLTLSGITPPPTSLFTPALEDFSLSGKGVFDALHEAIAKTFSVPKESVFSCTGTTGGVFVVLAALLSPGDVIAVEEPTYELLIDVPRSLGANVIRLPRRFEDGFSITEEALSKVLAQRPKVLLIANPHNPSGKLLSKEEIRWIIEQSKQVGTTVVVDEVYLPFSNEPSAYQEGAITISSPTKVSGLGDLRIGWIFAPPGLSSALQDATDMSGNYVSLLSARVMTRAFSQWEALAGRGRTAQRDGGALVRAFMAQERRLSWSPPDAGLIGFIRLNGVTDATPFIEHALSQHGLGLVPGQYFEDPSGFRLGFGQPQALLQEGLTRLQRALGSYFAPRA